jgi:WD40 repeat protein/DNA-binding SARP family transcriptional activator
MVHYRDTCQPLTAAQDDARMPTTADGPSAREDSRWAVRVLGPLEVRTGSELVRLGSPQQRLVLALLIASAGHQMTTDRLIADVWPDDPPVQARKTIQVYVSGLRRRLGGADGVLRTAPNGYRLAADRLEIDAVEFERAMAAANGSPDVAPAVAASCVRNALDLWMGTPYADVGDALPIRAERVRLIELRLGALERRIEADLVLGRHRELIGELEALTIEHPYRERFVGQLMLAQYRAGRQADALRTMRRARRTLDEELGIEPGVELRALEHRILTQDKALQPATVDGAPEQTAPADSWHAPLGAIRGYELREVVAVSDPVTVYRGYQASVGREVAVAVIDPALSNAPAFVRRFDADAQRIAELEHPHIVALIDHWRDPDGAYLVSRWVGGGRLVDVLASRTLSAVTALRMVSQIGGALSYAHRAGVVHGGLTTDAVHLDEDNNAYLGAFAVTRLVRDGAAGVDLVSGDQATANPGSPTDDVAGLAALTVEMLTGDRTAPGATITAKRVPSTLRAVLVSALSADPGERPDRVDDLVRALRRAAGVDTVGVVEGQPRPFADVRNPYKGLRAFGQADAQDFHGREELVAQVIEAATDRRLVAVVGPSGSGKSSVVRAGLLPGVANRRMVTTEMFPGAYPFEELETALLRVAVDRPRGMIADLTADDRGLLRVIKQIVPAEDQEVLLVIDQFEELFSLVRDADTQLAFMRSLSVAVTDPRSQLRVVVTLRADFFDRPLQDAQFGELLKRGLIPVTVPTRDELARAVSQPAAAVGLDLEPGLTGEIVRDVEGQPGVLPLLQYALTELFRTRTSNRLTVEDYRRIGGVTGALGTRAEELYADLAHSAREAARQVFLRLVTVGEGPEDLRRRVRVSELSTLPLERRDLDTVLERYGGHRLLSFDRDPVTRGPTVEVAHEALLREWRRLRDWVDARRTDLILHRRFAAAVDEWESAGRDDSFLARGGRLAQLEDGVADSELTLTATERAFLEASRQRRAAERRAAEARARRQAESNRQLRRLLAGIGVLSVFAVIAGIVAFAQAQRAEDEAAAADAAAVAADARRVGAQALAAGDVDRALLLAVEGVRLDDSPDTRANLLTTLGRSPELAGVVVRDPHRRFGTVTVSPDGRTGAVYDDASQLRFFDTDTGEITATYETGGSERVAKLITGRAVFHPDGGPIAVSTSTLEQAPVRLLDPRTFTELPHNLGGFPILSLLPWGMAYSPGGARLAVAFDRYLNANRVSPVAEDSVVVVWEVATPAEPIAVLTDVPRFTHGLAFGPDGRLLYTASHAAAPAFDTDAGIVVHDVDTQSVVRRFDVPSYPFALDPDGAVIAVASAPAESADPSTGTDVLLLDAESGAQVQRLRGHTGPVTDVAFSADGTLMASAAADRTIAVWDTVTGDRVELLEGHAGAVSSIAFGSNSDTALSASVDGAVLAWDRSGDRRFVTVHTTAGGLIERSGGGVLGDRSLVSPTGEAVLSVVSTRNEQEVWKTYVQMVDVVNGRASRRVNTGHQEFATAVWHPDGEMFATVGEDQAVRVWDAATMTVIAQRTEMPNILGGAAYLDGGAELLVAGFNAVPAQRLDAVTLEPRAEPFTFLAGLLALPYAGADSDTFAMVTSDVTEGRGGNLRPVDDRLLLVDADSGEVRHDVDLGFDGATAAMSSDGSLVAVVGDGGEVGLVDVADGQLVRPPADGHDGAVVSVSYSPDGAVIATGGSDGRVALWDGRTGDPRGTVRITSAGTRTFVGIAPDGNTVIVATQDGRIHQLDVRPDRWIEQACAIAGRNLTRGEWRDAFGDRPYAKTCARA